MRQRIDHLEGLVKKLIAQRQNTSSPRGVVETSETLKDEAAPASDAQETAGTSKMLIDGVRSMYLNGDDWQIVLQEVL